MPRHRKPFMSLTELKDTTMARTEPLNEPLAEPLQAELRTNLPDWDNMTDEEIMRSLEQDRVEDKYAVQHLAPDGMYYQWVRCEVWGKPDNSRIAEVEQKGWKPVPQKRHDGRFMTPGSSGPIILDGQMLFEIPFRVARLKREFSAQVAHQKVEDMNAQLAYSPPGTGPRVARTPGTPLVQRRAGAAQGRGADGRMDMVVE
jgi:hypothetical protein